MTRPIALRPADGRPTTKHLAAPRAGEPRRLDLRALLALRRDPDTAAPLAWPPPLEDLI